ncbi:hypothetical protein ACH3VR_20045 [Microbacterium sp. B2969]|uniref:Alpha-L-rhamnosidase six-hairpin glycosidase domain-containing protein n=1 Tax=Microbacterium alkaliflavum TaxID=3248839 RepID=A0ABW7QCQ6_9MICO
MTIDDRDSPLLPRTVAETLARAREVSPDPFPDAPAEARSQVWWYAPEQYERGLLAAMVSRSREVNRYAHYSANYARPSGRLVARTSLSAGVGELVIVAHGAVIVRVDGVLVAESAGRHAVPAGVVGALELDVEAEADHAAAFAVVSGVDRVGSWSGIDGVRLRPRAGGDVPAHLASEPVVRLPLPRVAGLYEAPAEVLGRPVIRSARKPRISSGESALEARSGWGAAQESSHEVVSAGASLWASRYPLGLRYLQVTGEADDVWVDAEIRPAPRRGAFVCSDAELNAIWGVSAYTLRLCMQGLMIDGVKRDRMPWIGDQAISALANAYAFGDAQIAFDSHLALGSPTSGYVNGIADYSLWWFITADILQVQFGPGDTETIAASAERMLAALRHDVGEDGLFRPRGTADGFTAPNAGSVLIDWGYEIPAGSTSTALQMLWVWALDAVERLRARADRPRDRELDAVRAVALESLRSDAWDAERGLWRACADGASRPDPYANFLSVAAGVTDPATAPDVVDAYRDAAGRTPYMQTLALRALAAAGEPRAALAGIRRRWGGMLDAAATTFWEEFPSDEGSPYEMYGRPFGRSLCHAWAAGPAALLPEIVFGLRTRADAWAVVEVSPPELDLEWAAAAIPVRDGHLGLRLQDGILELDIPEGCTAVVAGLEYAGPSSTRVDLDVARG